MLAAVDEHRQVIDCKGREQGQLCTAVDPYGTLSDFILLYYQKMMIIRVGLHV